MTVKTNDHQNNKVFIRDNALILHFDTSETPFVSRFDLDSLAQANFEVSSRDGSHLLTLRDFGGTQQTIGQFSNKAEAHQVLYAILQTFLSHQPNTRSRSCGSACRTGWFWCLLKWVVSLLALLALLAVAFMLLPSLGTNAPVETMARAADKTPVVRAAKPLPPAENLGESVDLDTILPDAATR